MSFMRVSYGQATAAVQMLALALAITIASIAPSAAADKPLRMVVLGDSLSAGFGIARTAAFPARLEEALKARGYAVTIENAGVSGDTASGGLSRLDWSVADGTDAVIVELGANDALRGLDPKVTRSALSGILKRLKEKHAAVLLAGMLAPPNMGADYGRAFNAIFPELAAEYDVLLYPFFLDGVAAHRTLNLPDGIHPTPEGVDIIVTRILPKVEELIARVRAQRGS